MRLQCPVQPVAAVAALGYLLFGAATGKTRWLVHFPGQGNQTTKVISPQWGEEGFRTGKEGKGKEMHSREERRKKGYISLGPRARHKRTVSP